MSKMLSRHTIEVSEIDNKEKPLKYVNETVDQINDVMAGLLKKVSNDDEVDQMKMVSILISSAVSSFATSMANIIFTHVPFHAHESLLNECVEGIPDLVMKNVNHRMRESLNEKEAKRTVRTN